MHKSVVRQYREYEIKAQYGFKPHSFFLNKSISMAQNFFTPNEVFSEYVRCINQWMTSILELQYL